jgi:gas vesicle protein
MMKNEVKHIKCSKCRCWRLPDQFLNKTGRKLKSCFTCREYARKAREKNRDRFQCPHCEYKFSANSHLNQHIKSVHDQIKDFECKQCEFKCSSNSQLNRHVKQVHDQIKDFECKQCDYICSNNSHLNQHIKSVHDQIKDFECKKCNYNCSTSSNLKRHIKSVHDQIKDFECKKCNYNCSTSSSLKAHVKQVHDQIKDSQCPHCEFKCFANNNLKRHIKAVHDQIKDFECKQCEYKCSTSSSLKAHVKQVHDQIKDYQCQQCEFKCSTSSSLNQHMKTCTGELQCSAGEARIMKELKAMRIPYIYDSTYAPFTEATGKRLRFDFYLPQYDIFIEYNGKQHYEPVRFGGCSIEQAELKLAKQQRHDNLKSDFCGDRLLTIPCWRFNDIGKILFKFIYKNTDWGVEYEKIEHYL